MKIKYSAQHHGISTFKKNRSKGKNSCSILNQSRDVRVAPETLNSLVEWWGWKGGGIKFFKWQYKKNKMWLDFDNIKWTFQGQMFCCRHCRNYINSISDAVPDLMNGTESSQLNFSPIPYNITCFIHTFHSIIINL